MPQMAPYNWLILFLFFNYIMMLLVTHNHFSIKYNPLKKNNIMKLNYFKWMW